MKKDGKIYSKSEYSSSYNYNFIPSSVLVVLATIF